MFSMDIPILHFNSLENYAHVFLALSDCADITDAVEVIINPITDKIKSSFIHALPSTNGYEYYIINLINILGFV